MDAAWDTFRQDKPVTYAMGVEAFLREGISYMRVDPGNNLWARA